MSTRNMEVANIIWQQMGPIAGQMIGLRRDGSGLVAIENGLRIRFTANNPKHINMVTVELSPDDTYDVTFYQVRSNNAKIVDEYPFIHANELQYIFEDVTGLHLTLGGYGQEHFG